MENRESKQEITNWGFTLNVKVVNEQSVGHGVLLKMETGDERGNRESEQNDETENAT